MAFGFTPKHIEEFYLEPYTPEQFLIIALEAAKKADWDIQFISKTGFTAQLKNSGSEWNAEITFKIEGETATIKSKSLGSELFDWGMNRKTTEQFRDILVEFRYSLKPDDLDCKYEELRSKIALPEEDILNQSATSESDAKLGFLSFFIPREGYFVTPIIIDLNILIFILMIISGVNVLLPDNDSLLNWGANFRPLTLQGQWWRLITNCFLHIGIFHLLMNMYALLYIGQLLEPLIGKLKFLIAYLITGITASVNSLWWHDMTISAGASGAIFGMYGIFIALLTTNLIEKTTRKALLTSIGIFVFYNLVYGLKGGIDNAAHIGGLIGGLVIGFSYYPSLINPDLENRNKFINFSTVTGMLAISVFILFIIPNSVGQYNKIMQEFTVYEQKAMSFYSLPQNTSDKIYLQAIRGAGIPNWKKCEKLVNSLDSLKDLPDVLEENVMFLKKYCEYRIMSYDLMAESIEKQTNDYNYMINLYNQKIELIVNKLNGKNVDEGRINIYSILEFVSDLSQGVIYILDGKQIEDISNIKVEDVKKVYLMNPQEISRLYGEKGKYGVLIIDTK